MPGKKEDKAGTEEFKKTSKGKTKGLGRIPTIPGGNRFSDLTDGFSASQALNYDFSPYLIYSYSIEDPVIRAGVNKKAMKVISEGYSVEPTEDVPQAEAELKQWEEFAMTAGGRVEDSGVQVNFDGVLMNTLLGLFTGDEWWWEIRNNNLGVPGEINVLDWEDMRAIPENKHGAIKQYVQILSGKIAARWEPEEIIHRSMYVQGSRIYGTSLIRSVMRYAAGRMFGTKYANNLFVNQKPKGVWFMDLSDEEYKKIKDQIKQGKLNPHQDITLQTQAGKMKYETIATPQEMEYKDFIQDNRIEILVGMGVPAGSVYLPGQSGGWDSDVQLHEFDEDINRIRTFVEGIVNEQLFPRFGFKFIKFKINRSNKRDELKEAQIAGQLTSGILTINERRELLAFGPIEGGDKIVQNVKVGGFQNPQPTLTDNNQKPETSQDQDIEGETAGEKEVAKVIIDNVKYKQRHYFRKSFGGLSMFNKSISKVLTTATNLESKRGPKLNRLVKSYTDKLNDLLKNYIGEIKGVVLELDTRTIIDKILGKKYNNNLNKIADPAKEAEALEAIRRIYMGRSRDLSRSFISEAYFYGIDAAELETGLTFSKVALSADTLNFLENMNIDLIEGAFSEVAQRARTQIRLGLLDGDSIQQIARRLDTMRGSVEKIYKNRVRNIARTEVSRAVNMGSLEAYKNSGVINKVQVLIGTGPDETAACETTFGGPGGGLSKVWNVNEVPPIPNHPNCKCTIIPVID